MKKMPVFIAVLLSLHSFSQRGIGTNRPNKHSILELKSTSKGFLIPRMNQSERDQINPDSNAVGLQVYCTDCSPSGIYVYALVDTNKWGWKRIAPPSGTATGEMLYFDGIQWTTLPIGSTGTSLKLINGMPAWVDVEKPVITLIDDNPQSIAEGGDYPPGANPEATATDNIDGDISANIIIDSGVDVNNPGTYRVRYTVFDAAGNPATPVIRTVLVGTFIRLEGDNPQIISVGDNYTELGALAWSDIDGNITEDIITVSSDVDVTTAGTYTVSYTVTDTAGTVATVSRTVIVEDR